MSKKTTSPKIKAVSGKTKRFVGAQGLFLAARAGGVWLLEADTRKVVGKFKTADEAFDKAFKTLGSVGGKIELGAGDFVVTRTVQLPDFCELCGAGRSTRLRFKNAQGSAVRISNRKSCSVRDLCLICEPAQAKKTKDGALSVGVDIENSADCRASNLLIKDFAHYGVWLHHGSCLCEINSVKAFNCKRAGFCAQKLERDEVLGDFVPNLFANCVVAGGEKGFYLERAIVINLMGCQVFQTDLYGFHLADLSNSVALTGCRTFQLDGVAFYAERETSELSLNGNIFCWHRQEGIVLDKVTWASICGNEIIDTGCRTADGSLRNAVVLRNGTRGVTFSGNAVFNWSDQCKMLNGIVEDATCTENVINSNHVNYYEKKAIDSKGKLTRLVGNQLIARAYQYDPDKPMPDFDRAKLEKFLREY